MKSVYLKSKGIDNLAVLETIVPTPKANEVLVRINTVALNYRDLLVLKNGWAINPSVPIAASSAGAGVVEAVGSAVTLWKKGDRVTTHHFERAAASNEQLQFIAEYVSVPERSVAAIPDEMHEEEAAALSISGLAAWTALVEKANVQPGQTIVLQGTGGTSLQALQLAKALGARVIVLTGSAGKIEKLKSAGADHVINYKEIPEWQHEIARLTNHAGADVVVDVAGAGTIGKSLQAVKAGGLVTAIGQLSGSEATINLMDLILKGITLQGIIQEGDIIDSGLNKLYNFIVSRQIKPMIDQVFHVNEVQRALHHLDSGNAFGKVVIRL